MKSNRVVLSFVAILTFACITFAGSGAAMRVNVPFDFYAGGQQLPAGEYTFQMGSGLAETASVVTVRTSSGEGVCMLFTRPGTDSSDGKLLFNKYGSKHFLSSVSIQGYKAGVRMEKLEKELRAQSERDHSVITVAQR